MKKLISATIVTFMLISLFISGVSASSTGTNFGEIPVATGISLDGTKDAAYEKGLKLDLSRNSSTGVTDSKATVWMLWNTGFIYVFVEIADTQMVTPDTALQTTSPWSNDSMEVFLDFANDGLEVNQHRIDSSGALSFRTRIPSQSKNTVDEMTTAGAQKYFDGVAVKTAAGYNVEYKIPVTQVAGAKIGLQLQLNDKRTDGSMTNKTIAATGDPNAWDSAKYGYITLSATNVTPAAETPKPTSPKTADVTGLAAFVLIAFGAAFVLRRKNH